jgi:hypothetical protein
MGNILDDQTNIESYIEDGIVQVDWLSLALHGALYKHRYTERMNKVCAPRPASKIIILNPRGIILLISNR